MPRVARPVAALLRQLFLSRLRKLWSNEPLDLDLPGGDVVRLGARAHAGPVPRLRVYDDRLFLRLLLRGEMGGGESFVAGEWSADDLPGVVRLFLRATGARGFESPVTYLAQLGALRNHRRAANSVTGSERNIHAHYDLGNAFYRLFLDEETMAYSCAYWPDGAAAARPEQPGALGAAQRAKFERLCEQLELGPRDHLLEIGCGWGGMALHAAASRGCRVTAITVSREQHELARARVQEAGLGERVDIQYRDYRELDGRYSKLVSIEMLEAVGYEYLPAYFATCARVLEPGGRMALQSITMPDDRFDSYRRRVDWMQTYIFPGSLIPSLQAVRDALRGSGLALVRCEDLGPHYAPTLRAWTQRFTAQLPEVRRLGFDVPFVRTWLMYLAFSEAAFAERTLGDHQLLLVR
jgi:cyclopropane-fatty-acyl-phospholipid synthase